MYCYVLSIRLQSCSGCRCVSSSSASSRGPILHSPPPLRPYSMCPPPPLRESSGAGYRDYSPEPPPNSSLPPSHCSCHGPPQVSLLLDNGPSVARWDSDTSFSIRRQAYSSSEVTPPPPPPPHTPLEPLNQRDQEIHTNKFRATDENQYMPNYLLSYSIVILSEK